MTVLDFLRLTRRSWKSLLIAILIGGIAMAVYTAFQPKVYHASSTGFIASGSDGGVISSSQDAVGRIAAYLPLISTAPVLEKLRENPDLQARDLELVGSLSASVVAGTTMIEVSGTAHEPAAALALANGALQALIDVIDDIQQAAGTDSAVSLTVIPLQNASLPTTPIRPIPRNNIALGLLGGLLLGYLYVLIRRGFDTRLRTADELTELLDSGLFGALPKVSTEDLAPDATSREGVLFAESVRQIRTALSFSSVDKTIRSIGVTSSTESEGKTTVSTQLARVFARAGRPTILIDADLRRPAVARAFQMDNAVGLSELLSGQADFQDVIQRADEKALWILPAGRTPPNPSEMLGSEAFRTLLRELSVDHLVIVDAPPLLPVTDGSLISAAVDGIVFVAQAGRAKKPALAAAKRLLEQVHAHVLGVVLNMVPTRGIDSDGYGYYGKQYGNYVAPASDTDSRPRRASRHRPRA